MRSITYLSVGQTNSHTLIPTDVTLHVVLLIISDVTCDRESDGHSRIL